MLFEQEQDVLKWYQSEERVLTPEFLKTIPWNEISKHELKKEFIPVVLYMRDVERLTSIYADELRRTPTTKDPAIKEFMQRWESEETLHGDLLNRFLNEAGYPTSEKWYEDMKRKIPLGYKITQFITPYVTNRLGQDFTAVHMTWGAIQELSTLNGYQRLWELADHPVLEYILRAVAREEARHSFFYWSMARIKLMKSEFRQRLSRYLVKNFWTPVGEGAKRTEDTNYVIATLFKGLEGIEFMDKRVNQQIERLPGFTGLKTIRERIAETTDNFERRLIKPSSILKI